MHALPLLLLLTAGAVDDGPLGEGESPGRFAPREFRAGAGATAFADVEGIAPTAELGLELAPTERLGLRFTFGAATRVGWGSVFLSPEVVYRLRARERPSPYLGAGLQLAALNFTPGALGTPEVAEARSAVVGIPAEPGDGPTGAGPVPLRFSAGPQASAGVSLPLLGTTFDLALRYNLHFWEGDPYSGLGLVLTVVGPVGR